MTADIKDPYKPPLEASLAKPKRRRRYSPPIWVWVVAVICFAVIVGLRLAVASLDSAVVNIVTLILSFVALQAFTIWFLFFSAYAWQLRLSLVSGTLLSLLVLGYLFPIDHVDGSLRPFFRFRWSPRADERLASAAPSEGNVVNLTSTTPEDFPEFLGPGRGNWIEGPPRGLGFDWVSDPPVLLWRQPIGAGWSAFSAVNGFAVTMEQRGKDELVTCYEARTGKLRWSHSTPGRHENTLGGTGPRSTPTIHLGRVYALGATGVLHCLDGATGNPVWPSKDLREMCGVTAAEEEQRVMWGRSGSPLIVDDLVVVPLGGKPEGPWKSLVAFNKNTGEEVWKAGDRQIGYSSPTLTTLCGVRQIISVNEDNVTGHDPKTGKQLWAFDWPGRSNAAANASQAVPISPDKFFISKAYGGGASLVQLDREKNGQWNVEELWHNQRVLKTKFTNVVVGITSIYGLSDGYLECVDLETGDKKWKQHNYGQGQILGVANMDPMMHIDATGSQSFFHGLIFVQCESGEVALVEPNPEAYAELARFQAIEGVTWNNLCLHGRLLLVRNSNEAACYELPLERPQQFLKIRIQ